MENLLKIFLFKSCCEYKPCICFSEILSFRFLRQRMDSDQLAIARLAAVFGFSISNRMEESRSLGRLDKRVKGMMTERL